MGHCEATPLTYVRRQHQTNAYIMPSAEDAVTDVFSAKARRLQT